MRITFPTMVNNALIAARKQTDQLATLQQEASTGNRINVPSDDPIDAPVLLASQAQNDRLTTYLSNTQSAQSTLNLSVSSLQQANDVMTQAKSIAVEATNSANDAVALGSMAQQVDQLLSRLIGIGNTQQNGHYIYGGTSSRTAPFVVTASNSQGLPQTIAYRGSQDTTDVVVGAGQTVATFFPGSQIFQQQARGATLYSGNTGAAAGTGTDNATGQGSLIVSHTSTTYAAGSGVQPGTASVSGDTILGSHQLSIVDTSGTGASGTVSLDGGAPVAFTSADTDLKVTNSQGDTVYLDTSAITPGFNGTVGITGNGTLSVDGGASSVPISFTSNQVVTNSKDGTVTNVASSKISRTGTASLDYQGTEDAFQVLMGLRDTLRNTNGLPAAAQMQAISQSMTELDRVSGSVLQVVGQQSASLQNLTSLQQSTQQAQLSTQEMISNLKGADMAQVVVGLQSQTNLLQLTLASTAQLFNVSLLNFLH